MLAELILIVVIILVIIAWIWSKYGSYERFAPDDDNLYTITMTDPDAPNPDYLHWLVINNTTDSILHPNGETIVPYVRPSPPPGSGMHRYYTTVWSQQDRITMDIPERSGFNTTQFVINNHLKKYAESMQSVSGSVGQSSD